MIVQRNKITGYAVARHFEPTEITTTSTTEATEAVTGSRQCTVCIRYSSEA